MGQSLHNEMIAIAYSLAELANDTRSSAIKDASSPTAAFNAVSNAP
ncbi:hypothetical protein [Sphingorhabdus sp.]